MMIKVLDRKRIFFKIVIVGLFVILAFISFKNLYEIHQIKVKEVNSNLLQHTMINEVLGSEHTQGFPVRLKIPKINVDASVEYVGLTHMGEMKTPSNTTNVGWFALGPRPGEKGSAVIAGHFNGENSKPGVFVNLRDLKEGDKLHVEDSKGITISFIVRGSRFYNPGYADDVFTLSDSAHLNLITCDGVWDEAKKTYSKRLVVFTDIVR